MIEVTELNTFKSLLAIRDEWAALFNLSKASIFQSFSWQCSWWKIFGRRKRLSVLLVKRDEKLIGIAPFCRSSSYLRLPFRVLTFLGIGPSDYGDFIFKPGEERVALEAIFEFLLEDASFKWDVIDLHQLPSWSKNLKLIQEICLEMGLSEKCLPQETSLILDLPADWDDYLSSLSKKFRWNVNYYGRRLRRDFEFEVKKIEKENELLSSMSVFFKLHKKRWLDKKVPTPLLSPKYQAFHREVAKEFLKQGKLCLYFLRLNSKEVASLYGFAHKDRFYNYLGGFDPKLKNLSVATVLASEAIKESIAKHLSHFDFLRGEEEYKRKWKAAPYKNYRLLIAKKKRRANILKRLLTRENELAKKLKASLRKL